MRATHTFSSFSQVPYLAAEIAGSGPLRTRPFRVTLTRSSSALRAQYSVRALVDLRCAMACFADPALEHSLGYGLGLPPGALRQALGPHPDRDLAFSVVLSLPGKALGRPQGAPRRSLRPGEVTRSFPVALGAQISAGFRTEVVDTARLQQLLAWVCAGALVVLLTAASLVLRHRRRARRARRRRRGWV